MSRIRSRIDPELIPYHSPKWESALGSSGIGRVHAEYPTGTRFDISVLPETSDPKRAPWNQPVSLAIEIKLWQVDGTGGGVRGDIAKLTTYAQSEQGAADFRGMAVLLLHPGQVWKEYLAEYLELMTPDVSRIVGAPIALHILSSEGWIMADTAAAAGER